MCYIPLRRHQAERAVVSGSKPHINRSIRRSVNIWSRRLHRYGAIACLLPVLLVLSTGILLQLKKQLVWVQPGEQRGTGTVPTIGMETVLEAARTAPGAGVESWDDIDRLDVRPGKGLIKVQTTSGVEIQVDASTGAVLQVATRRSDLIESLHDGSFFGQIAKLGIFLPAGLILLGLWVTGAYLWLLPKVARRNGRRRRSQSSSASSSTSNPSTKVS